MCRVSENTFFIYFHVKKPDLSDEQVRLFAMIFVSVGTGDTPCRYDICCADDIRFAHERDGSYITRAGTFVGANIHEAQYAQSKNDFIAKLKKQQMISSIPERSPQDCGPGCFCIGFLPRVHQIHPAFLCKTPALHGSFTGSSRVIHVCSLSMC